MAAPSFLEEPQVAYLSRILEDVKAGNILVPRFQRRFVWRDEDRIKLFQSIRDGIPIGSLLVWRTSKFSLDTFSTIGGLAVPCSSDLPAGTARQYLLDGHQRLSTLFSALSGGPEAHSSTEEEFGLRAGDVFYDLWNEEFVIVDRGQELPLTWLPLSFVLDSIALLKYQRGLSVADKTDHLIGVVDNLANRFRNYKIPVIPLVSDDLDSATVAFQRINSSGRQMDDTHMVVALTYSRDFDLARELERVQSELASVGWQDFDPKYILAVVRRNPASRSPPHAEATSKVLRGNPRVINDVVAAITRTAEFLREECCIPSPEFVPYSYQAVILSYAFTLFETPDEIKRKALRNWLWVTTYTGFFRGPETRKSPAARLVWNEFWKAPSRWPCGVPSRQRRRRGQWPRLAENALTSARRGPRRWRSVLPRDVSKSILPIAEQVLRLMADQGPKCLVRLIEHREFYDSAITFSENRLLLSSSELGELAVRLSRDWPTVPVTRIPHSRSTLLHLKPQKHIVGVNGLASLSSDEPSWSESNANS